MGGKTVMADAQFGIAHILRPFANFNAVYAGIPSYRQIMVSEVVNPPGGEALDPLAAAGTSGIDPNLVRGLPVPFGSRVVIWIPKIMPNIFPQIRYNWSISWRLRNVFDYRQTRAPYHYPKQGLGVTDTSTVPPGLRTVIPAANQTIVYTQEPQPAGVTATVVSSMRIEDISAGGTYGPALVGSNGLPLTPTGALGAIQQGLLDPAVVGFGDDGLAQAPFYEMHEVQAVGDELLIGVWREPAEAPNDVWDFDSVDSSLFTFLGDGRRGPMPDVGVLVMCGSSP